MNAVETLYSMGACSEAIAWVEDSGKSPQELWDDCPRGDWLLWYAARVGADRRLIVQAACACARLALPYVADGDGRPRRAIEMAEAWTRGEATLEAVREASDASYAVYASNAAVDAYAADTAAFAAAAYAARAAYAAYAANAAAKDMQRRCADEVRKIIPEVPMRQEGPAYCPERKKSNE